MPDEPTPDGISWTTANRAVLDAELSRLRRLLERRVLWLRRAWKHDPLQGYPGMVVSDERADGLLAVADPEDEARFYREDPAAAALTGGLEEAAQEAADLRRALADAGAPAALDLLAALFGLGRFEQEVLLLGLAPELDPAFERLYAYVQDDVGRRHATPHLALGLFASSGEPGEEEAWLAARDAFQPEAPLRRFRLIVLEPGPPGSAFGARPLRLEERAVSYLLGVNRPDERLAELLRPIPALPLSPALRDLARDLAGWLEAESRQERRPVLNLVGPPGTGRLAAARALSEQLGLDLLRLDPAHLPTASADREETLRLLGREAVLLRAAFYLEAEPDRADPAKTAALAAFLERLGTLLIVGSRDRWPFEREALALRMPRLETADREALWRQALADVPGGLNGYLPSIVQQFELGPADVARAVTAARSRAALRAGLRTGTEAEILAEDVWEACRERSGGDLEELAQRLLPCHGWEDIVLPEDVYRQLREVADQVLHRAQVYEGWGFGARLGRGKGISALFSGPSGTGKTMAAEVLAADLRLDLYRIDLSGVVSKYIGETEKNLRRVFDAAERSGAILFFDEADALFGRRTEVKDSHDRYANVEVSYLLQRMEDYRGLAILATNLKSHLDPAFLRRLRFVIDFPFPDPAHRRRIWERVFPPQAEVEGLDLPALAQLEIPGGNIKSIAVNAAFLAAADHTPVGMEHVLRATRREYAKMEKMISEAEFGPYYPQMRGR
jgi:SpoVK/Ycf46/Vps4 family AAA+-type ATPase